MNRYLMYLLRLMPVALICAAPLAANSGVVSVAGHKLDQRLAVIAAAVHEHRAQSMMAAALSRELFQQNSPLDARWNAAGQVQVYLHYDGNGNPPNQTELESLGASGVVDSPTLDVVQAWIPAEKLAAAAALASVSRVTIPQYLQVRRATSEDILPRTGSVDTQGDQILGASTFRNATGYTGQGAVVGVISNGDSGVSTSQGSGDLPANIWNDPNNSNWGGSGAEGTAMMEIVYDIVPGLKRLGFASPATTADFLTALNDFNNQINANVVVDDLGPLGQSVFSNGAFATGVASFATAHPDMHLVTAAGNDETGYWAGAWSPETVNVTVNSVPYTQAMNFGSYNASLTCNPPASIGQALCFQVGGTNVLSGGDTIFYSVVWNDPWDSTDNTDKGTGYVSPSNYDVVLFDANGNPLACNQGENVSTANGVCNQTNSLPLTDPGPTPIQGNQWNNTSSNTATVYLQIFFVKDGMPSTRQFKVLINSINSYVTTVNPGTTSGSIAAQSAVGVPVGSALTPGEITVGAVAPSAPYYIEPYSSTGPVLFGTDDQGTFPYQQIQKPDFVAPDCVNVTGAGGFGTPFCGTSAAAPHIAGLIALLMSAYPGSNPYSLLQNSASQPGGGVNPNGDYGFGLPNVNALLTSGTYPVTGAEISSPAGGASIASGQSTTFQGKCLGYDGTSNFAYLWNFGSSGIPSSSSPDPAVNFDTAGTYTVTLTCTNTAGSGSANITVTVTAPRSGSGGSVDVMTLGLLVLLLSTVFRRCHTSKTCSHS